MKLFAQLIAVASFAVSLSVTAAPEMGPPALDRDLEKFYVDLHQNPELAFQEKETASKLANRLRTAGYQVTTGIGGTGVVGILRNGSGPTVMLRADMDALPIEEKTGLTFASKVTAKEGSGLVPVSHACGHDLHVTALAGTGAYMAAHRGAWRGTLVVIGQPAEEGIRGAKAMLKDGLFTRFPKPDYALAIHVEDRMASGKVGWTPGWFRTSSDSVDVILHGRSGHGAKPHETVDTVLLAARTVVGLNTIVSREIPPGEVGVITVGTIHGGTRRNIVPEDVTLELTVRAYEPTVRRTLLAAIERVARGEAAAAGAPKEPTITVKEGTGAVYNDPDLTERAVSALQRSLGADAVVRMKPQMTSEDFSEYGLAGAKVLLLHVGAVAPAKLAAAGPEMRDLPSVHTPYFAPDLAPTLNTAMRAEVAILEDWMRPR